VLRTADSEDAGERRLAGSQTPPNYLREARKSTMSWNFSGSCFWSLA
jgi:hypothetical protein